MRSDEIREAFVSFFEQRGHLRVPSSSLVPASEDTSTLLTVAGMQQFKPYFEGREQPPSPRLTSAQRTFRTVDIEVVGTTKRHLTFFEMLGNFSVGDYFKAEALHYGWELSTGGFGFDPERIWVTVFAGDEALGLGPDEESIEIWREIGVPDGRIVRLPASDNFWQAGATGPCGPCSEMYIDRGPEFGSDDLRPGDDTDRFLEYWNHVMMTYELREDGSLTDLPQRNIDTGLGLERMAVIQQGVDSVFDTDAFTPLIALAEELSGTKYGSDPRVTRAMRIIADHMRGSVNLIADGVVPSNEDRGYVLRRIMRRAIQQGRALGLEPPYLGRFAERMIELMSGAYPHLEAERDSVMRWVSDEEENFGRTLDRGTDLLAKLVEEAKAANTSWIDAEDAFRLHDTYGFPYDLTKELLAEQGLSVDDEGFEALMEQQRTRARAGGADAPPDRHQAVIEFASGAAPTTFVGYSELRAATSVAAATELDGDAQLLKLEESPFYAEGGGQVADSGVVAANGSEAAVEDVYRVGDDQVIRVSGRSSLVAGQAVEAVVDAYSRHATMRNHTATHLLHAALRERLGSHVRQAGSAVRPDKLRFDFTHGAPLDADEVRAIEDRVNDWVKASHPVRALEMARARGGGARRDGAVRREVRRLGADGRGRRGLARALRRHARRQHGRGRDRRDRLRELERRKRAPDRGAHRARRDRLVPGAQRRAHPRRRAARITPRCARRCRARRRAASPSSRRRWPSWTARRPARRSSGSRPRARTSPGSGCSPSRPGAPTSERCSTSPTGSSKSTETRRSCSAGARTARSPWSPASRSPRWIEGCPRRL